MFSRWVEAFPCKHVDTKTTATYLLQDIIPRWGILEELSSDNGSHFVNNII